jgi:hypothetical protein
MRRHFLLFFILCCGWSAWGQTAGANPFELRHRLPKVIASADTAGRGPVNPFDVVPHRPPAVAVTALERDAGPSARPEFWRPELPRGKSIGKATLFWVLVVIFAFLAFSIALNRTAVERAWRGFLGDNALAVAQREASGLVGATPYFLLYGNFLLNAGFFIFLIVRTLRSDLFNNFGFLLLCMVFAFGVFLSKHLLLGLLRALFDVESEVRRYNFLIIIFNCVLGLFLVPFNFVIAFAAEAYRDFLVFWTLGLVMVFYAYRSLRAARIGVKFLAADQFHFLLYLCSVEIAPVLLLVKLAALPSI